MRSPELGPLLGGATERSAIPVPLLESPERDAGGDSVSRKEFHDVVKLARKPLNGNVGGGDRLVRWFVYAWSEL